MTFRGRSPIGTLARFATAAASVLVLTLAGTLYGIYHDKPYPTCSSPEC